MGVHEQASVRSSPTRVRILYAYLAYKLDLFGLAYDVINKGRPNMRSSNLKVLILCEVGRVKDAIDVAKDEFLFKPDFVKKQSPKSRNTPVIKCVFGMNLFD